MQNDNFEKEDITNDENSFLNLFEKNDLKDIFILSEILNNTKFDQ
ncbi:MAG: hypothetical protein KR126chlam4_01118 [Candidatus Anoxychlamydiales bacterium]|nr:hypothetical protein [Candidatus Anoxychlamydiales bacterium]